MQATRKNRTVDFCFATDAAFKITCVERCKSGCNNEDNLFPLHRYCKQQCRSNSSKRQPMPSSAIIGNHRHQPVQNLSCYKQWATARQQVFPLFQQVEQLCFQKPGNVEQQGWVVLGATSPSCPAMSLVADCHLGRHAVCI